MRRHLLLLAGFTVLLSAAVRAEYSVNVDLENQSGEDQKDWPVVVPVFNLLGRNLPAGSIHPDGWHVFDEKGAEIAHAVEKLPPYDQPGASELVFVVPSMAKGQKLTYRIANTAESSGKRAAIEVVEGPHNLIPNGGFERTEGGQVAGFAGEGALASNAKRSGKAALLLKGSKRVSLKSAQPIPLHKGSYYYFGAWGKTEHVSRHALYRSKGGHFVLPGFENGYHGDLMPAGDSKKTPQQIAKAIQEKKAAEIVPQCATRDWAKTRFRILGYTDWGLEGFQATAAADRTELEIVLDQQPQFWMKKGETEGSWWLDDLVLLEQPQVTVRFDQALEPKLESGVFLFARPAHTPGGNYLSRWSPYCAKPFAHEAAAKVEALGWRGRRVPFLLGLYHTKALSQVKVSVKDNTLSGPGGAKIELEEVEFAPGYLGEGKSHLLRKHAAPVDLAEAPGLPYFCASFVVPADAKPGRYTGSLDVEIGGKAFKSVPLTIRVQDLDQPEIRDRFIGVIFQGNKNPPYNDEGLRQYARSGFTSVTPFFGYFKYKKLAGGEAEVDLDHLATQMEQLRKHGITGGVCPFTEFDLGPKWGGGRLWKATGSKEKFLREVKRVDEFVRKHPEWPRMIYMTWDEPQPGRKWVEGTHGGPDPRMGWINEAIPDALTNIDAHFWVFGDILKYYTMPTFDDPPDFAGPEIYAHIKAQGKDFGFAGAKERGETRRYMTGLMMLASGARYFHQWHLRFPTNLMEEVNGEVLRSIDMIAMGEGLDDLKMHRILSDAIAAAKKSGDAKKLALAKEAEGYLAEVFQTWTADHNDEPCIPYLGTAASWGAERFYDEWQERMARYAVALKGGSWVE